MNRLILKEIIEEQRKKFSRLDMGATRDLLFAVEKHFKLPHALVVIGLRRVGKSTFLAQIRDRFYKENYYYFSFEDERLFDFKPADFNILYELFLEIFGSQKVFFLDEVQNISGWENFVRRMQEDKFKFFITGSNASLLSRELGTKLTGRHVSLKLTPFSFREYLRFLNAENLIKKEPDTKERARIKKYFNEYLKNGGMPEYLKYKNEEILKHVYEDVLYRDIAVRYGLKEIKALREIALYLLSNIANLISYNKLKDILKLGSVNTVKKYIEYLENSFLFFPVNIFSFFLKQQFIAPKKIFCIDNGLVNNIAFKFSENKGKFLENLVFLELKRQNKEIFYYKTADHREIDFLVRRGNKVKELIQVSWSLEDDKVKERELNSLKTALIETGTKEGLILTYDESGIIKVPKGIIKIMPVWQWLLNI